MSDDFYYKKILTSTDDSVFFCLLSHHSKEVRQSVEYLGEGGATATGHRLWRRVNGTAQTKMGEWVGQCWLTDFNVTQQTYRAGPVQHWAQSEWPLHSREWRYVTPAQPRSTWNWRVFLWRSHTQAGHPPHRVKCSDVTKPSWSYYSRHTWIYLIHCNHHSI